jgi:thiamine-phosphate pyrophosphorylase
VPLRVGRPVICVVTDRRRLGQSDAAADALVALAAAAARGGADLIQLRERDLSGRDLLALARRLVEAVEGTPARVVVNDRLDVAMAAGAGGVHLRGDSMPAARVREIAPPGFLVGRSVHDALEAAAVSAAGGVDYLIAGTLFETSSKPAGRARLGLDAFGRLAAQAGLPVLGIGGVTLDRAPDVVRAGGAGIAAIGLFLPAADGEPGAGVAGAVRAVRARLDGLGDRAERR